MYRLLEIIGRGLDLDPCRLVIDWFSYCGNEDKDNELFEVIELIEQSKVESAYNELASYLRSNPDCVKGNIVAAAIHIDQRQLDRAIIHLKAALNKQINNTLALFLMGYCLEVTGEDREAVKYYQDCLKFKAYLKLPSYRLASYYFKNGQIEKTIEQYDVLQNNCPENLDILMTLGYLNITRGELKKAEENFNKAILMYPDSQLGDDDQIQKFMAEGEFYQALEVVENTIANQGENATSVTTRADILALMGSTEESIAEYKKAIWFNSHYIEPRIKLGSLYRKIGDRKKSAMQYLAAMEINDKIVDTYIGLVLIKKLQKKRNKAISNLMSSSIIMKNSQILVAEATRLLFIENDREISGDKSYNIETTLEQIVNAYISVPYSEQSKEVAIYLAMLLMAGNNYAMAGEILTDIYKANPADNIVAKLLSFTMFEQGDKKGTLELLKPPELPNEKILETYYETAILYCDKLKFASTMINFSKFYELGSSGITDLKQVSQILQEIGVLNRAEILYDNINDSVKSCFSFN